jgi:hypothetical protein
MAASGKAYLKLNDGTLKALAVGGGSTTGGGGVSFDTNFYATPSGNLTLTNANTYYKIPFDTIVNDGNSEWDAANTKWVCGETGTYLNMILSRWESSTSGIRQSVMYIDGVATDQYFISLVPNASGYRLHMNFIIPLSAGQTLEVYARSITAAGQLVTSLGTAWAINRLF